jgi:hypothetical protein
VYSFLTFAQAAAIIASRLEDTGSVYWSTFNPNEILNCVIESVRTFQALTGSYKQQFGFVTAANLPYYDLTQLPGSPMSFNATDVEIANNVLAALLEPPLTAGWTGTGQFTFTQIQNAIQQRLNRFLGDTGSIVTQTTISNNTPPPLESIPLPDATLDVRRAAWLTSLTAQFIPAFSMSMSDEWAEQAYGLGGIAALGGITPLNYSVYMNQPLLLRLIPPPSTVGFVDCLLVQAGPTVNLDPAAPVVLGVPDDLSPAIKWGAISDLLSGDGLTRDPARASYAETRYNEFVQTCKVYPSLLLPTPLVCSQPVGVGSINDLDSYMPDWEQQTAQPFFIGLAGRNMMALGPVPNAAYPVAVWLSPNAPVLNGPAGFIQLSRDQIDPMLDMAQHIACFKMGGAEFTGTDKLFQNFVTSAKMQNDRLSAVSFWRGQIEQPHEKSEMQVPRMLSNG